MSGLNALTGKQTFVVRGWHVAAGVVAFFLVIIGVDTVFLTLAYRTHPGQVADKPYEAGLVYNAELRRLRAEEALGWKVGVAAGADELDVTVQDRVGTPLSELQVSVDLQRPATERGRQTLHLAPTAPGRYAVSHSLSGAWDVSVKARDAEGRQVIAERRLEWP